MRWSLLLVAGLLFMCGCHECRRTTVVTYNANGPERANLALGPSPETSELAALFAERSDWPSVDIGYRVDDVTFYTTTTYDVQMRYDRDVSLYVGTQSVQAGTWIR